MPISDPSTQVWSMTATITTMILSKRGGFATYARTRIRIHVTLRQAGFIALQQDWAFAGYDGVN